LRDETHHTGRGNLAHQQRQRQKRCERGDEEGGGGEGGGEHTKTLWRASRSSRIQSSPPRTEPRGMSLSARLRCEGRITELRNNISRGGATGVAKERAEK
jgi:hypothetical protein